MTTQSLSASFPRPSPTLRAEKRTRYSVLKYSKATKLAIYKLSCVIHMSFFALPQPQFHWLFLSHAQSVLSQESLRGFPSFLWLLYLA